MIMHIPGPAGRLESLVDHPASRCTTAPPPLTTPEGEPIVHVPKAIAILAHPHPLYGGSMHTKAIFQAAKAFCRLGCAVMRFNFRGVGTSGGDFADGVGEIEDFRAAVDFMTARYPGVPVWAAGMSFGSYVAMTAGARDPRVTTLVGIAAPVKMYDFDEVAKSEKPKFLIHGEGDELCALQDVWEFYGRAAEPKELVVIDAANHLFEGHVSEVADAIEDLLS